MRPPFDRRRHRRYALPGGERDAVEFRYPGAAGPSWRMPLRDLSASGLSIVLAHDLPGLEVGSRIDAAVLSIGQRRIRGDLLVMHVTRDLRAGSVCGALFYPDSDRDLLALRAALADLEAATKAPLSEPAPAGRAE